MSEFFAYLQLGFQHITDIHGYDHILFVIALCAIYRVADWRRVLILITAFTIGHSITLALATLNLIDYRVEVIEFLIPLTILITCLTNLAHKSPENTFDAEKFTIVRYPLAMIFGLVHGMGFSTYLRSLLGKDESIVSQLFAFNIGLEFGQMVIVALAMMLSFFLIEGLKVKKNTWNMVISGFVAGVAFKLMLEKCFF
jgi:HupE / UreJ protein